MWVDLPAGPVEYEDVGDGPVIVLVHGVVMNSTVWRHVVPVLAPRARVITPTLPLGSHRRPMNPGADLTMRGQVHLLADFLDALEPAGGDPGGERLGRSAVPDRRGP